MNDLIQLQNKNILIMGVANERSLAWGVAKVLHQAGAKLAFTYRKERSYQKLSNLLEQEGMTDATVVPCDVNEDESIKQAFSTLHQKIGTFDGIVHAIAFAHGEDLQNDFIETTRSGYAFAQDTSAYSLIAVAREARTYLNPGASIVTMSALGAERVLDGYKVMGVAKAALESTCKHLALDLGPDNIRINAISAGPIRTLASQGVPTIKKMLKDTKEKAPLKRNVTQEEVGNATLMLLSPLSSGVTGEVLHVDGGYNIMG